MIKPTTLPRPPIDQFEVVVRTSLKLKAQGQKPASTRVLTPLAREIGLTTNEMSKARYRAESWLNKVRRLPTRPSRNILKPVDASGTLAPRRRAKRRAA